MPEIRYISGVSSLSARWADQPSGDIVILAIIYYISKLQNHIRQLLEQEYNCLLLGSFRISMNKLILAIVGLLLLIAGVYYFITKDKNADVGSSYTANETTESKATMVENTGGTTVAPESSSGQGSFASLMAQGQSVKCTYSGTLPTGRTFGTFYTDGNQHFRIETTHATDQGALTLNTINDSGYTYSWGTGPTGAIAIKVADNKTPDASATGSTGTPPVSPEGVDLNTNIAYSCNPWSGEPSFFQPPTDVEFMDMGEVQKSAS